MALFDLKGFAATSARGPGGINGLAGAIGTSFGFPSCLLNLTQDLVDLISSTLLKNIDSDAKRSGDRADDVVKGVANKLRWINGVIEYELDAGIFKFISDICDDGLDRDEGKEESALGGFLNALGDLAQQGGQLYENVNGLINQFNDIKNCIKSYSDKLKFSGGNASKRREELASLDPETYAALLDSDYAADRLRVISALDFIDKIDNLRSMIGKTLAARQQDPTLEPVFKAQYATMLSGTGLPVAPEYYATKAEETEVFRLVYGPPKSKSGQFVFSRDGLYFDSQVSGLKPALIEIAFRESQLKPQDKWTFNHDPNLGGRGKGFSTKDLDLYFNTILDPNKIDDSTVFKEYYDKDGFLQDIIGQRNKRIYDLSADIVQTQNSGAAQAVVYNLKQALISENAMFQEKINKRKKQIELAVKMPAIYKGQAIYSPGEVPINDFSYLEGINVSIDLQKQKALVFNQADVSGSVMPVTAPVFVVAPENSKNTVVDHLFITDIGEGAIVHDGSSIVVTSAATINVTDEVVTDSLYAMYNFLETNIETPSSTSFTLRNYASPTEEGYAQLVAKNISSVFGHGLGIAYLKGITEQHSSNTNYASSVGSYVKLPDENDFNDLMYHKNGATIDFWVHVPKLNDVSAGFGANNASGLYRLVLANENVGALGNLSSSNNQQAYAFNFGDNVVNGFVMGFTRDRRLVSSLEPSNDSSLNPSGGVSFFLAPTQSLSMSAAGFVNRNFQDYLNCNSGTTFHCMTQNVWTKSNDVAFSSCGRDFCHVSVTFNPYKDEIKFYLDGVNTTTSSMHKVFGVEPNNMPKIPTFKKSNSFEYRSGTVGQYASNDLKHGPKLNTYFTPWILGGGYTDGMSQYGNFMGGTYGGQISGLKGYLGSFKLYKKPLTQEEIIINYNAQKEFFKNIDTSGL